MYARRPSSTAVVVLVGALAAKEPSICGIRFSSLLNAHVSLSVSALLRQLYSMEHDQEWDANQSGQTLSGQAFNL
jgi:hypothetical protein